MCAPHSPAPHPDEGTGHGPVGKHDVPARRPSPLTRATEKAILFYRRRISANKPGGGSCRFEPTCSAYGLEAVRRFGAIRGLWLALLRIIRCAPWHPGGWDPVPRTFPHLGTWWKRMHG